MRLSEPTGFREPLRFLPWPWHSPEHWCTSQHTFLWRRGHGSRAPRVLVERAKVRCLSRATHGEGALVEGFLTSRSADEPFWTTSVFKASTFC